MSAEERRRIEERGIHIPLPVDALKDIDEGGSAMCPALVEGKCSVYDVRPLICRMWGVVESMPCTFGCEAKPGLLVDDGAQELIRRSLT